MFTSTARRVLTQAPSYTRTAATAAPKRSWTPYKKAPTATSPSATAATPPAASAETFEEPTRVQDEQYDVDVPAEMDAPPPSQPAPSLASSTAGSPFAQQAFPSAAGFPSAPIPIHTQAQEALYAQQQAAIDWATSFHGISSAPFSEKAAETLMRPLLPAEIEIKPDGLLYLPEILYRRILNKAFGPGGWGMVPRGEMTVGKGMVSREWGLWVGGRLVSIARGEQTYFDPSGLPTATEGCKSNALMRCCKDLGIASELWDPGFIRGFKASHCVEAWTEHVSTKKKQKRWRKKGNKFEYPLKEAST